jgi:hypothetical protein
LIESVFSRQAKDSGSAIFFLGSRFFLVLLFRRRCVIEYNSPAFCETFEDKCEPTVRLVVCALQFPPP